MRLILASTICLFIACCPAIAQQEVIARTLIKQGYVMSNFAGTYFTLQKGNSLYACWSASTGQASAMTATLVAKAVANATCAEVT